MIIGKKSLRKNKITIANKLKNANKDKKDDVPYVKQESPQLETPTNELSLIDAGCGIANRRFENDQEKVINRAFQSAVDALIIFSNDFDKQDALMNLAKTWTSRIYFLPGIHPDNIKVLF